MENILIILYTFSIFLIPHTLNIFSLSYSKLLMILSVIMIIYNYIKEPQRILEIMDNKVNKFIIIGVIIFTIIILISTIYNTIKIMEFNITDYYEVLRPILYLCVFLNYMFFSKEKNRQLIFRIISISLIIHSIVAITQYINIFNINELYVKQLAPTQYITLVNNYPNPRTVGLTGNPNVFGMLMSLGTLITLYKIFQKPKKIFYYFEFLLYNIILFTTASRSSYISCIIMNFIFILVYKYKIIKELFICLTIYIIFMSSLLFLLPNNITWRIKQMFAPELLTSWQKRSEKNEKAIKEIQNSIEDRESQNSKTENDKKIDETKNKKEETTDKEKTEDTVQGKSSREQKKNINIKEENNYKNDEQLVDKVKQEKVNTEEQQNVKTFNFIIGNGVTNINKTYNIKFDNEWILILFQYGITGIIGYLIMFILPLFYMKHMNKMTRAIYISLMASIYIYMIPAAIYHSYLLFSVIMMILGLVCNEKRGDCNENSK